MFMLLFFATGVGNASTFQMIPAIMRKEMPRLEPGMAPADRVQAGGDGIRRDHRLHLGDRGLWRLLHPEELRHLDRASPADRKRRCGASCSSTSPASPSPGGSTRAAAACCATSSAAASCAAAAATGRMKGRRSMSHFLDRLTFFNRVADELLRRPRRHHRRGPALGGRLSQALAARQDRALDARRELHRLLLVEDLRQGRHRHLGNAADRLSAHAARPAEP